METNVPHAGEVAPTKDNSPLVEGSSEAALAPKQDDPQLAAKIAQAKREKIWRQKLQAMEQKTQSLEAKLMAREELKSLMPSASDYVPKSRLKSDLYGALADAGITPDDMTQYFANAPSQEVREIQELRNYTKSLEEKISQMDNRFQERDSAQYQQALNQIRSDVKSLVVNSPEFETVQATGSHETVVRLIEKMFKETGTVMTVEEAAMEVENELMDQAIKLANLPKIKQKLTPQEVAAIVNDAAQTAPQGKMQITTSARQQTTGQGPARTLTNAVSTTAPNKARSRSERRERALLAAMGQLK